eukprot:TRINITY_DN67394_c9_g1_i1.p1 TRINITY_DN67394_c9_g1~~TRINITY_DN67394_c9_g1_i1.p1  ORF type:complete len:351 (+),score=37.40 TRINITY_DN67394_c9_g1_i1:86-1054(+)
MDSKALSIVMAGAFTHNSGDLRHFKVTQNACNLLIDAYPNVWGPADSFMRNVKEELSRFDGYSHYPEKTGPSHQSSWQHFIHRITCLTTTGTLSPTTTVAAPITIKTQQGGDTDHQQLGTVNPEDATNVRPTSPRGNKGMFKFWKVFGRGGNDDTGAHHHAKTTTAATHTPAMHHTTTQQANAQPLMTSQSTPNVTTSTSPFANLTYSGGHPTRPHNTPPAAQQPMSRHGTTSQAPPQQSARDQPTNTAQHALYSSSPQQSVSHGQQQQQQGQTRERPGSGPSEGISPVAGARGSVSPTSCSLEFNSANSLPPPPPQHTLPA